MEDGFNSHYPRPTPLTHEDVILALQRQADANFKVWISQHNHRALFKEALRRQLSDFQYEYPVQESRRGIATEFQVFSVVLDTWYAFGLLEAMAQMPKGMGLDNILHDVGILTFTVMLKEGEGDEALAKWARTSFKLLPDGERISGSEKLSNILYSVCEKIEFCIEMMRRHVEKVQEVELKRLPLVYNDEALEDLAKERQKDSLERWIVLEGRFEELRGKVRERFGDADEGYKGKQVKRENAGSNAAALERAMGAQSLD